MKKISKKNLIIIISSILAALVICGVFLGVFWKTEYKLDSVLVYAHVGETVDDDIIVVKRFEDGSFIYEYENADGRVEAKITKYLGKYYYTFGVDAGVANYEVKYSFEGVEKYSDLLIFEDKQGEATRYFVVELSGKKLVGVITNIESLEIAKQRVDAYKESGKSFVEYFGHNVDFEL